MTRTTIYGTQDDDVLHGDNGANALADLGGNDVVFGHAGADHFSSNEGNDVLFGGRGRDTFDIFDMIDSEDRRIAIEGGRGHDTLYLHSDEAYNVHRMGKDMFVVRETDGDTTIVIRGVEEFWL